MKHTNKIIALLLVVVMALAIMVACTPTEPATHECHDKCPTCGKCTSDCTDPVCADKCTCEEDPQPVDLLPYAKNTELRVAGGYQKTNEAISFQDAGVVGEGVQLPDGKTYKLGDLKPTWQQISDNLGIKFTDKFTGAGSAEKEFKVWKEKLGEVDIVAGNAVALQEAGAQGLVINIAEYLEKMPNFKAYLQSNTIVNLSITGDTKTGAIYFSPYFDGVDDIERYPLIRADFVMALLDGTTTYAGANRALAEAKYQPYMPTSGKVTVKSLTADGKKTQDIVKDYDKTQNIVAQMNAASALTGDQAVAMFRKYIDDMYGSKYAKRSDLFLGYDAAWDADELVALLRCAVASLNDADGNAISGMFSRETSNNQRQVDLFRFAGSLFGVRGMESRKDYLYFDKDGNICDARCEESSFLAMERMNALYQEGLIIMTGSVTSSDYLAKDAGLVSYDYCQTQTVMNATKLQDGEKYTTMMVPVAKWFDGSNADGVFMRFTESWRSVKTDGWAISKAGVSNSDGSLNMDKLNACLKLFDFAFSPQGQITMSYGSDAFIKVKDASVVVETWEDVEKKYETFNFNGQQMPIVSDAMFADLQAKEGGNYTNYARRYLGSTLNGFPKSQAFEYQCTHAIGKEGAAKVSAAIALGTIKHPELAVCDNMWYTSIPTTFPFTAKQNTQIKTYKELSDPWSTSKGKTNIFLKIIEKGYAIEEFEGKSIDSAAKAAQLVAGEWNGELNRMIAQTAWDKLLVYYTSSK